MKNWLESLSVEILAPHERAFMVRIPTHLDTLKALEGIPSISIQYGDPDKKLDSDLSEAMASYGEEISEYPIIIGLFDKDSKQRAFADRVRALGIQVVEYDENLYIFIALATTRQIHKLADLDFVLFIELDQDRSKGGHDRSMAVNGVDYIRNSGFIGSSSAKVGILDSGFMLGSEAAQMHNDLNKKGCGKSFIANTSVWNDEYGHGTRVLATLAGTGNGDVRFRGVAPGIAPGIGIQNSIRAAKVFNADDKGEGQSVLDGIKYMGFEDSDLDGPRPEIINFSGGRYIEPEKIVDERERERAREVDKRAGAGADDLSKELDDLVWKYRQLWVVCGGNHGPSYGSIWSPGTAKNALTVGNVWTTTIDVGTVYIQSSRGPTKDGRMKPDLVSTGTSVISARAGSPSEYEGKVGCSYAVPHVAGIAVTLMEHYPEDFHDRPQLLRAHLMASSILDLDRTDPTDNTDSPNDHRGEYGLGRISDYQAHWDRNDDRGWQTFWAWQDIDSEHWAYFDVDVPQRARRLVAVMTWDEPTSPSDTRAVIYDLDLWVDNENCPPDVRGRCGNWSSRSKIDNVEYVIINDPPAGKYRFKIVNSNAPTAKEQYKLPAAIAVKIIRGDPNPNLTLTTDVGSNANAANGNSKELQVVTTVQTSSYEAYGVRVSANAPDGVTLLSVSTDRKDGVRMTFPKERISEEKCSRSNAKCYGLILGSIVEADSRSAVWTFLVDGPGDAKAEFGATSTNGGICQERQPTASHETRTCAR